MDFNFDFNPTVLEYFYLYKRENFTYESDTYKTYAVFAVENGSFSYEADGGTFFATAGEVVICPPSVLFKRKITSCLDLFFIRFELDSITAPDTQPVKLRIDDIKRLDENFMLLKNYVPSFEYLDSYKFISHVIKDIIMLYVLQSKKSPNILAETDDEIIKAAVEYICENAFSECNLGKLADILYLSPVQLIRRFKKETGSTPSEFMFSLKIDKAKKLLSTTDYTLAKIAPLCGYENEYYFSRIFRKKTGQTPTQFRKINNPSHFTIL